jgi:hypothetical protein
MDSRIENKILTCLRVWERKKKNKSNSLYDKYTYWLYKHSSSEKELRLTPSTYWNASEINSAIDRIIKNNTNLSIELQFLDFKTDIHDKRLYVPRYRIIINKRW